MASLRARPSPGSELVTQEVFGETVRIAAARADWVLCGARGSGDSSKGWLPLRYLAFPPGWRPTHFVARRFAALRALGASDLVLPMGSLVQVTGRSGPIQKVALPGGGEGLVAARDLAQGATPRLGAARFAAIAREVIGTPYLWGGTSTFGFDCSGLVQFLFGLLGKGLPRNSCEQARVGRPIRKLSELRPLDLLFFGQDRQVDHVAIHLGSLRMLHASGWVRIESLSSASEHFRADLLARFKGARRLVLR
ncbi:MAG TPA: C40 family peptidase [bacterium]|nr:C40 family peptidase [bacterium]